MSDDVPPATRVEGAQIDGRLLLIAGGNGSAPAPVARYIDPNFAWNPSSNSSCRWRRKNPNK
jgi:hypothetical protein